MPLLECCPAVDVAVELRTPLAESIHRFLRPRWTLYPLLPDERTPPQSRKHIHIVEEFGRSCGLSFLTERSPRLEIPTKARERIERRLRKAGLQNETIAVIHTGPTWQVKEWPTAKWRELVNRLQWNLGVAVIQIGHDYCGSGEPRPSPRVEGAVDWVGQLCIKEMLALLKRAKVFVGIDSGMLHLAGAVCAPCVGLFGPTDGRCFLPRESPAVGVTSRVACLGCHHHTLGPTHWRTGCPSAMICMSELAVNDVFVACSQLCGRNSA